MKLSGAHIVWESLVREGVEVVFGISGGAVIYLYDVLPDYPVHHVLVRHEQAAAHAADGYARATGKVGVCLATSGPGATNLVTGIATAYMDSSPLVAITGQVPMYAGELLRLSKQEGVIFTPGPVASDERNTAILHFSHLEPNEIEEGISRLGRLIVKYMDLASRANGTDVLFHHSPPLFVTWSHQLLKTAPVLAEVTASA